VVGGVRKEKNLMAVMFPGRLHHRPFDLGFTTTHRFLVGSCLRRSLLCARIRCDAVIVLHEGREIATLVAEFLRSEEKVDPAVPHVVSECLYIGTTLGVESDVLKAGTAAIICDVLVSRFGLTHDDPLQIAAGPGLAHPCTVSVFSMSW
jgi:hypothetical protein